MHFARPGGIYLPSTVTGTIAADFSAPATISPSISLSSFDGASHPVELLAVVKDAAGAEVGRSTVTVDMPARGHGADPANLTVAMPSIALNKVTRRSSATGPSTLYIR